VPAACPRCGTPLPAGNARKVRIGLGLLLLALLGLLGTWLAIAVLVGNVLGGEGPEPAPESVLVLVFMAWGWGLVAIAGLALCLAAPRDYGARALASAALVLAAGSWLCQVLRPVLYGLAGGRKVLLIQALGLPLPEKMQVEPAGGRVLADVLGVGMLLALPAAVVFLFFLRALARWTGSEALASGATRVLALLAAIVVGLLVARLLALVVVLIGALALAVMALAWGAMLLWRAWRVLGNRPVAR
jgi:hypothetical protein